MGEMDFVEYNLVVCERNIIVVQIIGCWLVEYIPVREL